MLERVRREVHTAIKQLEELKNEYSNKEGWIVESKDHLNVGDGNGIGGTAFTVKSVQISPEAQIFKTREEAEKLGADYNLIDGAHRPIEMIFTRAYDFFARELDQANEFFVLTKEL